MGYITSFAGRISITPPIPWGQAKDSPFMPTSAHGNTNRDVKFVVEERQVETEHGVSFLRQAVALVASWEDEMRGYDIVDHVQEAIGAYPDHEFTGRFDCAGESPGDVWRLEVHDRRAVRVEPRIVWPDGSEGLD